MTMMTLRFLLPFFLITVLVTLGLKMSTSETRTSRESLRSDTSSRQSQLLHINKRINLVYTGKRRTPNPEGWEEYDGSIYNPKRGYGWLADLSGKGRDRGASATIVLADGTKTSPQDLGRLELANMQGSHQENKLLVFRIDLPDGLYRVSCTSVNPGSPLPLVDQRSFKCRAHDVVFAGANYGPPLVVGGNQLAEGTGIVEVTDGHLRIVVGDPAYGGWTWTYRGPWYKGWKRWWGHDYFYANGWYQKFTRTVDPGFHSLRLNSLEVERIAAPAKRPSLVFRDFFNRDNSPDVNAGVANANRWIKVKLHPYIPDYIRAELYQTSIKLTGPDSGTGLIGLLQQKLSPKEGVNRYSTRVSLFTGEGSQRHSGTQEAGILMLAEPSGPTDFNATFVGVAIDSRRSETMGSLIYRVGDGNQGYRTDLEVLETTLPFRVTEGEFEIIVEHDVAKNILRKISVNGMDVTDQWPLKDRTQRIPQGLFGVRSVINNTTSRVILQQFYWHYRLEIM